MSFGRRANFIEASEVVMNSTANDQLHSWRVAVADKDAQITALQTLCNAERNKWAHERKAFAELITQFEQKLAHSAALNQSLQEQLAIQQKLNTATVLAAEAVKEAERPEPEDDEPLEETK